MLKRKRKWFYAATNKYVEQIYWSKTRDFTFLIPSLFVHFAVFLSCVIEDGDNERRL